MAVPVHPRKGLLYTEEESVWGQEMRRVLGKES
jgi:hypothetical protein